MHALHSIYSQREEELTRLCGSFIEKNKKCRVVHCVSLLVIDEHGRLFLWRTASCATIPAPKSMPSSGLRPLYEGPHAVNERLLARAKSEAFHDPDPSQVNAIISSPSLRQSNSVLATAGSPTHTRSLPSFDPFRENQQLLRSSQDWDKAMEFLPSTSSLSRGRRRALSAAHLISSQKRGCCGDYCHVLSTGLASRRLDDRKLQKQQLPNEDTRRKSSVFTATAAAIAFTEAHPIDHTMKPRGVFSSKPSSPQRLQREEEQAAAPLHTIPFKLIAQTRAEKQLVDLFIRRYQNGEDGDYLAEEYYGDGDPLGTTFPGYYYQEVQVCKNCFEFYMLVERVRMKAHEQIARRRTAKQRSNRTIPSTAEAGRANSRESGDSSGGRLGRIQLLRNHQTLQRLDEQELVDEMEAESIWRDVWMQAKVIADSISKNEAAELYSFLNPHPAIAMVLSALAILLLVGKEGDYNELKRCISQDKLLVLLRQFELDRLTLEQVMKAAAHARNPLFSPVHIAPVSSCAARFCEWIRTVLQAFAWKDKTRFRDQEANRVLRFLRPELLPAEILDHEDTSEEPSSDPRSVEIGSTTKAAAVPATRTQRQRKQKEAARRAIQDQQMARLAAPAGLAEIVTHGGSESVFTCEDGVTQIPFTIAGQAVGETTKCNLVVFHDLFDTMDGTKVFFRSILARHVGARALFFNIPGQGGTAYATESAGADKNVFNNVWISRKVHELLTHLQQTKRFITSGMPFHVIGFGNGANIAACYTILYGSGYSPDLQSLTIINGFAKVDAQMSAILHSAVNVFSCFPPSRPDLPVTYFCKFLFSDAYLAKIDTNLALSIYTAVTNVITLDGRIRLCQGALLHMDLMSQLQEIHVPLVVVQSIENALVAPTNVDPFLQGRVNISHVWSHQQLHNGDFKSKTKVQLQQALATPDSAFVSWLRAGHEVRQEAKPYVTELIELLVTSKEADRGNESSVGARAAAGVHASTEHVNREAETRIGRRTPRLTSPRLSSTANQRENDLAPSSKSTFDAMVKPVLIESQVPAAQVPASVSALPPAKKSAYELQLERSEQAFQDAIKTHEAQKAEFEKKRWLQQQQQQQQQAEKASLPLNAPASISHAEANKPSRSRFMEESSPPQIPANIVVVPSRNLESQPNLSSALEIESVQAKLDEQAKRIARESEEQRHRQRMAAEERMEALRQEQEQRRKQWEQEDRARLAELESKLAQEQAERVAANKKREQEALALDIMMASSSSKAQSFVATAPDAQPPSNPITSLLSPNVTEMKQQIRRQPELPSVFDRMEEEERAKKRIGLLRVDDFDDIKQSMQQTFRQGTRDHESFLQQELLKKKNVHAACIQKHIRRYLAVVRVQRLRRQRQEDRIRHFAGGEIVRIVRGFIGRRRFKRYRRQRRLEEQRKQSSIAIQRLYRGHTCRVQYKLKLRIKNAITLQRVYRGCVGRAYCHELREQLAQRRYMDRNASKLQATWKMHVARDRFLTARFSVLAATEIQRMYRGRLGRLEASRKKQWKDAEPGPERLALGLKMIEGTKQAFDRQQNEIDALHRAQEAVERQVSTIHSELQDSEKELAILERELQEIDQLESDLHELTHEAEMLHQGGIEGLYRSNAKQSPSKQPLGSGIPNKNAVGAVSYEMGAESVFETKEEIRQRQADAYAVEMAIQIKKAEREKKKKDLEAEFASVFAEVQQKRQELAGMEDKLADMEATRMRKDREFARLQRNLMELLEEQKLELENLREKGIELETATATSAAAAAATAMKAKEHEKRSQAMFESTEELMKFQFMSMSLSYFSSLNMLKNLRDINADTTSAAITSTAETAAAVAAAAAAANIPTMKRLQVGGADLMMAASELKKTELAQKLQQEEDAKAAQQRALPGEVQNWVVDDVGRWLDSLSLGQYKKAFAEGAVDGAFLLELRPEDMSEVLGVSHKLHVRKILVARNKLLPLSQQEKMQIDAVSHEEAAGNTRVQATVPDLDTVFSQARNGRLKRLIESVDAGFDINMEDEKGNTLLLLACQNVNMKMVEFLVAKRANVNHKNAQGNTPLHFAMAYDSEGTLGEYLIGHGADDTIENVFGLTPYDGLTPE